MKRLLIRGCGLLGCLGSAAAAWFVIHGENVRYAACFMVAASAMCLAYYIDRENHAE